MQATLALGRSGRWEIRYTEQVNGSWRSRTVSTRTADRTDAERFMAGWLAAYQSAATAPPQTVGDLIEAYRTDARSRGVTRSQLDILAILDQHLGQVPIAQLTPAVLQAHRNSRVHAVTGKPVTASTLRRELITLGTVLRFAAKVGHILANDIPYIALPPAPAGRDVWLDAPAEERLLTLAAKTSVGEPRMTRIHRFVWLALCTGARRSAILELRWPQVSLTSQLIDYRNQQRTKKRRVPVPISDRLLPLLAQAHEQRVNDFVLDTTSSIRRDWTRLTDGTEFADLHVHDLRRTFATLLAQSGVDMWQIAGLLGDTLEVVTAHYAHHSPGYLRAAVNRRAA